MSTVFTYKINAISVTTVGDKSNVIKQVEWNMIGTQNSEIFQLSQTTTLPDPTGSFIELSSVTEAEVIAWVTASADLESIESHIKLVLDKLCVSSSLTKTDMPWAPAVVSES